MLFRSQERVLLVNRLERLERDLGTLDPIHKKHAFLRTAARTLGLTDRQVLTLVRGPQAFRLALAPMTNDFVALLKDSSLVSVLTVLELTKETQIFATNLGSWVIPGTLCAALYLAMSLPLAAVARRLEQRWKAPSAS